MKNILLVRDVKICSVKKNMSVSFIGNVAGYTCCHNLFEDKSLILLDCYR